MDRNELIERLKGYEWNDIEFKEAQWAVPKNAYETVSAFSNTNGGWLIFGVRENNSKYEIIGVIEADKLQNSFLNELRSGNKISRSISVTENMIHENEKTLLIFYIPEVRRQEKPIFLDGDIRRSYLRKGGSDVKCSEEEIRRFIIDAGSERYDSTLIELNPERCFDKDTVRWYRKIFHERKSGYESMNDSEFLHYWGLVAEKDNTFIPTRAGILLFGSEPAFRQILPRPVVDCQWIPIPFDSEFIPEQRWSDRIVIEENLFRAWRILVERYQKHAETPFQLDLATLHRVDVPSDYIAFREAAINLLIHQDYSDHTRKAAVSFYTDRAVFWNPGDAFVNEEDMFEPGEKEVRNPKIVSAFRRIGLSEQAGTGVRSIYRSWQKAGNIPPVITNDKSEKSFKIELLKETLMTEEQMLFQAGLGVRLSDAEAKAFAYLCVKGTLRLIDVKIVTGFSGQKAKEILDRLTLQSLITSVEGTSQPYYLIADHLKKKLLRLVSNQPDALKERLVSDQPDGLKERLVTDSPLILKKINEIQLKIIMLCDVPRSMQDIMKSLDIKNRTFFQRTHLEPLLRGGILEMKYPDKPNHPNQAYVLSISGVELKARRLSNDKKAET